MALHGALNLPYTRVVSKKIETLNPPYNIVGVKSLEVLNLPYTTVCSIDNAMALNLPYFSIGSKQ